MQIESLFEDVFGSLPEYPTKQREANSDVDFQMAVRNALRYIPKVHHEVLAKEFADELAQYGHIYAYRFMPNFDLKAAPLSEIPAKCQQAAAIIGMILNNLDREVAQFPQELVTYGGNGQVFSNWIQFRLTLRYLSRMTSRQTLVMYSGHPLGLFPSHEDSPRVTVTNGMMIPNFSTKPLYDKLFALGVTQYGQMTAGSYAYIGPQGIVHGTTITVMNAGRRYLGVDSLAGKVFVTSGLGGMSGAQPKAATIAGCISVTAEVSAEALLKRHKQGWLDDYSSDLDKVMELLKKHRMEKKTISIGYLGNIVDLWERLAEEKELLVDLGSDQTSLHNPFLGGYYPVGISVEEADIMMTAEPERFKQLVRESLLRHIAAIDKLAARGMHFWDYGNAFLVDDIFSMGFGPFRWVCTSQSPHDLDQTDKISCEVIEKLMETDVPAHVQQQYLDNKRWIEGAAENRLVVGSQARILYSDQEGRIAIALAFNDAIRSGRVSAPIVLARDHHDVSGTDSPFRETSDVNDGSAFTADMAVQNVIGDSFRGATWVSLHNGGGVGWGDVINGGFGLLLDGSEEAARRATSMLQWDVSNGVARRSWSGNRKAREAIQRTQTLVRHDRSI
ncbi:unnamed protein product [Nippostrongylus brasiliensis]|uniref:Urocanate hydratase n=1 Tax=Nippostrongylus brasiliensis TaxID=27835 RepID=A0A0N4XV14_NIPBR|nr:unnamed protein product [Nippostrongylus brasiliensis]